MNGELVLKKARGLLFEFRSMSRIPCTLKKLLVVVEDEEDGVPPSPSMMSTTPTIECVRTTKLRTPSGNNVNSNSNSSSSSSAFPTFSGQSNNNDSSSNFIDACQCSVAKDTEANLRV